MLIDLLARFSLHFLRAPAPPREMILLCSLSSEGSISWVGFRRQILRGERSENQQSFELLNMYARY